MTDEQLTRLFRSLDEPADPDQAFADALFARLEQEAGLRRAPRAVGVRWTLLAAAMLVALLVGTALAVGSGLIKFPLVIAVATSSPSPTATSSGSPVSSPTASASPSETPISIPEPANLDRLVATPDGFLAIGSAPGKDAPTTDTSVLLRGSADGQTWQSIDSSRFGTVVDGAVGPAAWVLIANSKPDLSGNWVVWRSTDGVDWTSNAAWTTDRITSPLAVTAGPSGFAITGSYGAGSSYTTWTSPDGLRWSRASVNLGLAGGSALVLDHGFLAYQSGRGGDTPVVFVSADGVSWEAASSPAGSGHVIAGLAQVGSNLVAVTCAQVPDVACIVSTGKLEGSAGSLAIHWQPNASATQQLHGYRPAAITAGASGGFVYAYDLASHAREVLSSRDGLNWTPTALAADAFGGGLANLIAAGNSAIVGLGWTDSTLAGTGRDLWVSQDGTTWNLAASAPLFPSVPQVPGGDCPPAPTTVKQLMDIGTVKAAACYGSQPLTVKGYSSDCGGCGGAGLPAISPDWIGGAYGSWYISPTVTQPGGPGDRMAVYLSPSAHLSPPAEGTAVTVTGHFEDAASTSCEWVPFQFAELPPHGDAVARCSRSFVITAIAPGG